MKLLIQIFLILSFLHLINNCAVTPPNDYITLLADDLDDLRNNVFPALDESMNSLIYGDNDDNDIYGGFYVSIVFNGTVLYSKGYGYSNTDDINAAPTDTNVFRLGSVSKSLTALLMMKMLSDGDIASLDDPVSKYYPKLDLFQETMPDGLRFNVTFRQLASHTAGFPREVPCDNPAESDDCDLTLDEVIDRLISFNASNKFIPSASVAYSNLGIGVLGHVLAEIKGQDYDTVMQTEIFDLLDMSQTGFNQSVYADGVISYGALNSFDELDNLGFGKPDGGIYSSGADMEKMLKVLTNPKTTDGEDDLIFDRTVREQWFEGVYLTSDGDFVYGMPWEIYYEEDAGEGAWNFLKSGAINSYSAYWDFYPHSNLAATVLANNPYGVSANDIVVDALNDIVSKVQANYAEDVEIPTPDNAEDFVGLYKAYSWTALAEVEFCVDIGPSGSLDGYVGFYGLEIPVRYEYIQRDYYGSDQKAEFRLRVTPNNGLPCDLIQAWGAGDEQVIMSINATGDAIFEMPLDLPYQSLPRISTSSCLSSSTTDDMTTSDDMTSSDDMMSSNDDDDNDDHKPLAIAFGVLFTASVMINFSVFFIYMKKKKNGGLAGKKERV